LTDDITWNSLDRAYASRADAVTKQDLRSVGKGLTIWIGVVGAFLAWLVDRQAERLERQSERLENRIQDNMKTLETRMTEKINTMHSDIMLKLMEKPTKRWWT
jgi:hypothetical protein